MGRVALDEAFERSIKLFVPDAPLGLRSGSWSTLRGNLVSRNVDHRLLVAPGGLFACPPTGAVCEDLLPVAVLEGPSTVDTIDPCLDSGWKVPDRAVLALDTPVRRIVKLDRSSSWLGLERRLMRCPAAEILLAVSTGESGLKNELSEFDLKACPAAEILLAASSAEKVLACGRLGLARMIDLVDFFLSEDSIFSSQAPSIVRLHI